MISASEKKRKPSLTIAIIIAVVMLAVGSLAGYWVGFLANSSQINSLQDQLSTIREEVNNIQLSLPAISQNQSDALAKISLLETQFLTIQGQIDNLRSFNENNPDISQIKAQITNLQNQLTGMQQLVNEIKNTPGVTYQNVTYVMREADLSQLFEQVRDSVVTIQAAIRETDNLGRVVFSTVQGSGFVGNFTGQLVVVTCNHVVENSVGINVTFASGDTYSAALKGASPSTDVAVLTTSAPQGMYRPLSIVNSSSLKVGNPVIVIGTPYGLEGSMSTGIVSATNRTITVDQMTITNMIQTTAPLNPGNSGGPLMDYQGQVLGMADAIIQESQGIGLAIPSSTIIQETTEILS